MQHVHNILPAQKPCTKHNTDGASRQGLFDSQLVTHMLQAMRVCRLREVDWQTKHVQLAAVVAERLQEGTALLEQHGIWCEQQHVCRHTVVAARHDSTRQHVSEARRHLVG